MIHTKVASILNPTQVILAAGSADGVREGMVFVIYELGEEILDPETVESLGRLELIKGKVKVTHVQDKLCQASTLQRKERRIIDPLGFSSHLREMLTPREVEETVFEQLQVEDSVAVKTDRTVRRGDLARSIE